MEQFPGDSEPYEPEWPRLDIDLSGGPDGDILHIIDSVAELLQGTELEDFKKIIGDATAPGGGSRYEDILAIVNSYTDLTDTSGRYPQYGRTGKITAAVKQLHEQLLALPDTLPCSLEGLYPEFGNSDCGPEMYLVLLREEIRGVEEAIERSDERQRQPLESFRVMLLECAAAFRRAGVA